MKAGHGYLDSLVNLKLFSTVWPLLGQKSRRDFVRRAMPMSAGVSNVVIRNTWMDREGEGRILEYFRVSPAGPMLPLVLAPTTFGQQMTLGITYRPAAFPSANVHAILQAVQEQLETPAA